MNARENIWRDTARPVRFVFLDARSLICFGLWLAHMSKATFYLALASLAVFFIVERFGVTPAAAMRFARLAPFSKRRERLSLWQIRRNSRW